jgi:membrane protease YdiL (CAAX protease family)
VVGVVSGMVPFFVVLVLTDGLGEETGWRGFALPRLLDRTGALPASLFLVALSWLRRVPASNRRRLAGAP